MKSRSFPLWLPFTPASSFLQDPLVVVSGEGCEVVDQLGNRYLDLRGGLWNVALGYGNEPILAAIEEQARTLAFYSLFHSAHPTAADLAQLLVELTPDHLRKVILTCTGSAATEVAIKVIRMANELEGNPRKKIIVSLQHSYHGSTYGSGAASERLIDKELYGPGLEGFLHVPAPYCYRCPYGLQHPSCNLRCADAHQQTIDENRDQVAAFIMEPVLGSGGIIVPPDGYIERVASIARSNGVSFIADEVATGFGRTGTVFACEPFAIEPDVLLLGKGINSGYLPLGAVVLRDSFAEVFDKHHKVLPVGSTQDGNPIACAAAIASIQQIADDALLLRCREIGRWILGELQAIQERSLHVGDVRGVGLMLGIELVANKSTREKVGAEHIALVCSFLKDRGLIVYPNPVGISLFPPLVLTDVQAEKVVQVLDDVLTQIRLEVN